MIQEETHRIVREALDGIPLDRRAVLLARVVHGMSELETAEALSIPQGTVKTRLRRAKQELRDGVQRREREENRAQAGAFLLPLGELLHHERQMPTVPAEMRARLWEQLQSLLAQPGVPANDGSPAPGPPPLSALRRLLDPEVGRILGGALVGGALVFALGPIGAAPTPLPTREATGTLASDASRAAPSTRATVSAAPTVAVAPSLPRVGKTSAPAEAVSAAELSDPPESATLIKAAAVAFEHHDAATAREALEAHARDFPRSKLGATRELLWVRVLLSEGKRAEAQAKADALRKAAPQSPAARALEALLPGAEVVP
jgi:RNA polymerase sigma-70 factor (ECF subfamily)